MTDLTNVPVRNINDLELAENIPLDASVLDAVKIPVGGLTQFTQGEALSLKQLREVLVAAMPGWVPSTIDDLIARSDAEVQKMLEKYLNAIKDVSVVLDAIQGQINESHLALELNKKIDIGTLANGAAARAQETANAAYAAAGAAADAARAEGQAAIDYAEERVSEAEAAIAQAELNIEQAEQATAQLILSTEAQVNEAKAQAQQLTEQARQAAQALVTALDEKFAALNGNINTEISNLNAGLTQETTARQEGLAQITTTLNAYKVVVDDNLAVLFSKNETIVSDAAALATQVNALKSQVALVEGALPLKLDASVIQNYYTKAQSEANATSVAAGEITKYDSQLVIGGVNLFSLAELKSYAGGTLSDSVPYVTVTGSTLDVTNQGTGSRIPGNLIPVDYTKDIIISWYPLGNYTTHQIYYATQDASGAVVTGQRSKTATKGADGRIVITIPKSELSPTVTHLRLGLGSTSNTTYSFKDVQVEQGSKVTAWAPSPRDTQASLNANATAIQNTDTEVSRVNDEVVSQGQSLTTLQNNLNVTNSEVAKKANATVVDGVTSRVAATESGLTSVGNRTTALENSVNHATTGLSTKASTSALSTTNSNVSAIDGTVKGHTNQLTNLAASIQTINGTLSNKLDASVINNYYTKAQSDASADTIAAGKIDQFNASLIIGGVNLIPNSDFTQGYLPAISSNGVSQYTNKDIAISPITRAVSTVDGNNLGVIQPVAYRTVKIEAGKQYTLSLLAASSLGGLSYLYVMHPSGIANQSIPYAGSVSTDPNTPTRVSITFTADSSSSGAYIMVANRAQPVGAWLEFAELQLEAGSKATAWSPSPEDVQNALDANATALQTTNAEVARVDGKTTVNTNSITSLTGEMTQVKNGLTTKAEASALQNYYTKSEAAANATTVAAGEVAKYDSSLKVGGENLWSLDDATLAKEMGNATVEYIDRSKEHYKATVTAFSASNGNITRHDNMLLSRSLADVDKNSQYTLSFEIRAIKASNLTVYAYFNGANTVTGISVSTEWQRFEFTPSAKPAGTSATFTAQLLAFGLNTIGWAINDWYEVRHIQMQKGTKATAFSKATLSLQKSLDANATAINNTNTEVSRVDGKTVVNANNISGLTSRMGTVEGKVSTKAEASALQNYYTKTEAAANATTVAAGEVAKYDASLVIGGVNLLDHRESAWERGTIVESKASGSSYAQLKLAMTTRIRCSEVVPLDSKPFVVSVQNPEYTCCLVLFDSSGGYLGASSGFKTYSNVHKIDAITGGGYVGVIIRRADNGAITVNEAALAKVKVEYGTKETTWAASDSATQNEIAANATAITNTNTEVARVDGRVTTESNRITSLQSGLTTTNNNVTLKADQTTVTALAGRVTETESGLTSANSNITSLKSSIAGTAESITANGARATLDAIGLPAANVLLSANTDSMTGSLIKLKGQVHAPVTNSKMLIDPTKLYKLRMRYRRTAGATNYIYIAVINYNASGDRTVTQSNGLNPVGTPINSTNYPISYELPALNLWREVVYYFKGKSSGASTGTGTLADPRTFPALAATVDIGVLANYNKGNDLTQEYEIDYLIFEDATNEAANNANAAAITSTNTEVSRINGVVSGHTTQLSNLTASIAGKADTSALNALIVRVADEEGKSSSQSTQITELSAGLARQEGTSSLAYDYETKDADSWIPHYGSRSTQFGIASAGGGKVSPTSYYIPEGMSGSFLYNAKRLPNDRKYRVSFWARKSSTATGANYVTVARALKNGNFTTSYYTYVGFALSANGEWQFVSVDIDYSAQQDSYPYLYLGFSVNNGNANGWSEVQGFRIDEVTILPDMSDYATAAALNTLDAKVFTIDGKVTTQASQLTQLSSSIQAINGTLNTKLDSSVISNYYTKAQSDASANTIATGKIDVFKSSLSASAMDNLVIGGNEAKTKTGGYLAIQYQLSKPVVAGKTYTIRAKVSFSNGGNATANLRFYLGGQTAFHPSGGITAAVEDIIEVTAVASASTTQQVSFYCFPNSTANANAVTTVHWVEVFEGSNLTLNEKASAAALTATNSEVSRINGVVAGQATQLTTIEASVGDALDTINIKDTRSVNQPPTWYRANYARRRVTEFKTQTTIGVGGFFGGTYCNLETLVQYGDSSGGPILQTATATNDPTLYVQRYSTGSGTSEVWGAWTQPIKDLRDGISGKADASVVNAISVKVDGMSSHASQLSTLTSELNKAKNQLAIEAQVINGIQANYMVKMETNGVLAGFGLIQESGAMGTVTSSFGVNANNFFIGAPSSNKKPFVVTTTSTVINGVTYPAGTWIDTAMIANATIGGAKIVAASIDTAQITDGAITNAKIENLAVTGAKIANATIGTAQIANLAVTAAKIADATITNAEIANATITGAKIANATIGSAQIGNAAITSAKIGDLEVGTLKIANNAVSTNIAVKGVSSAAITTAGTSRLVVVIGIETEHVVTYNPAKAQLRLLRNGTVIDTFAFKHTAWAIPGDGTKDYYYTFVCALPHIVDTVAAGTHTYSVQVYTPRNWEMNTGDWKTPDTTTWVKLANLAMTILELKK